MLDFNHEDFFVTSYGISPRKIFAVYQEENSVPRRILTRKHLQQLKESALHH
jgi:hypothetical protein